MTAVWILVDGSLGALVVALIAFLATAQMRVWRAYRQACSRPPDLSSAQVQWANEKRRSDDPEATLIIPADDPAYIRPVDWQVLQARGRPWPFRTGAHAHRHRARHWGLKRTGHRARCRFDAPWPPHRRSGKPHTGGFHCLDRRLIRRDMRMTSIRGRHYQEHDSPRRRARCFPDASGEESVMSPCQPTFQAEHVSCVIPSLANPWCASLRPRTSGDTGSFLVMTTRPCKPTPRLHRTTYATPQLRICRASVDSTSSQPSRPTTTASRQNELRRPARCDSARNLISPCSNRSWMACGGCEFAQ